MEQSLRNTLVDEESVITLPVSEGESQFVKEQSLKERETASNENTEEVSFPFD
jgi:hypothetical protein